MRRVADRAMLWSGVAALGVGVLVWPAALWLDANAVEAVPIEKHDAARIEVQKATFDPSDRGEAEVAEIYGTIARGVERKRYAWPPEDRLVRPEELPGLVLFDLRTAEGGGAGDWLARLQVQTVWFLARWVALGAAGVGIVLLVARWVFLRGEVVGAAPQGRDRTAPA
jgi:hypothetical protein